MSEQRKISNGIMKVSLEGIQDIVGSNGLKSILNYAHLEKYANEVIPQDDRLEIPLEDLQKIYVCLRELFGNKGADSIQLRVGRENARRALEGRPAVSKSIKLATSLLPEHKKMGLALQKYAEDIQKNIPSESDSSHIDVKEEDDYFFFTNDAHFESEGVTSERPVCKATVGMLQYIMEWITGHPHEVEEIECRAMGRPADVFRVTKARKEG